ncbi:hypothetical protein GLYMA_06G198600v4 [Glycine max]|nr:hypothetical protein GLYMA_06G198600v4 [Glycine max]
MDVTAIATAESIMPLTIRVGNLHTMKLLEAFDCKIDGLFLHEATTMVRIDAMEFLLARYDDELEVDVVDSEGRKTIHVAAREGHTRVIQFCIAMEETLIAWIRRGGPHSTTRHGRGTCLVDLLGWGDTLLRAVRVDNVHDMKKCLGEGVSVNGRDQNRWTSLHWATFKGRIKSVKVLLEHSAEVETVDDAGYTLLHCDAEVDHLQVALYLIAHGASQPNLIFSL